MKKQAVFLFIPLFFAFSYLHEYKLPHLAFTTTPQNASAASSNDYDIYSANDSNSSSWRDAFLSRNALNSGSQNNANDTQDGTSTAGNTVGATLAADSSISNTEQ